jgi:PleD family two-component response regulator
MKSLSFQVLPQLAHEGSAIHNFVTISLGVATTFPTMEIMAKDLIFAADQMFYQAKENGRNRVCFIQL